MLHDLGPVCVFLSRQDKFPDNNIGLSPTKTINRFVRLFHIFGCFLSRWISDFSSQEKILVRLFMSVTLVLWKLGTQFVICLQGLPSAKCYKSRKRDNTQVLIFLCHLKAFGRKITGQKCASWGSINTRQIISIFYLSKRRAEESMFGHPNENTLSR